ncbi:hypothetical protein Acr_20g0010070 [Actinidia rufa]|uniref:Uncharacterized protein n=1 Tax=Actinidia rufa TaxID=165716 RepID=A0A7J0GEI5_9ERIC|nr:hypothetical protein Acr_20g0010070 [Actinidia rufa]
MAVDRTVPNGSSHSLFRSKFVQPLQFLNGCQVSYPNGQDDPNNTSRVGQIGTVRHHLDLLMAVDRMVPSWCSHSLSSSTLKVIGLSSYWNSSTVAQSTALMGISMIPTTLLEQILVNERDFQFLWLGRRDQGYQLFLCDFHGYFNFSQDIQDGNVGFSLL